MLKGELSNKIMKLQWPYAYFEKGLQAALT